MSEEINGIVIVPIENIYTVEEPLPIETQILHEQNNTETITVRTKNWNDYVYIILCVFTHIPFVVCNLYYLVEEKSCISINVSKFVYYFIILNTFIESFSLLYDLHILYFIGFKNSRNIKKYVVRFFVYHFIMNLINVIIYSIIYYTFYTNMTLNLCSLSEKNYINVLLTYNIIYGIICSCSITNYSN